MTPSKNDQTEEKRWNMFGKKDKSNATKTNKTTRRNKSEGTSERRKNISRRDQTTPTK